MAQANRQVKKRLTLVLPNKKYFSSFVKGEREYWKEKNIVANNGVNLNLAAPDFTNYNKKAVSNRKGVDLEKGRVPATIYWAIAGNTYVGRLDVRHRLNKNLKTVGGHIGYSVVPSERNKGYATEMLRLGLQKARRMGIKKALVTCDEKNIASRRVIEKNGGILENKIKFKGTYKLRFWIK